jgi:hypothetical protein
MQKDQPAVSEVLLRAELTAKNKCGSGQPPKPHCYRGRSICRLSPGEIAQQKRIASPHSEKRHASMLP